MGWPGPWVSFRQGGRGALSKVGCRVLQRGRFANWNLEVDELGESRFFPATSVHPAHPLAQHQGRVSDDGVDPLALRKKESSRRPDRKICPALPCRRRSYCGGRIDGDTKAPAGDDVAVRRYLRCAEQRSRYLIKASRARPMSRQSGHLFVAGGGNPRRRALVRVLGTDPRRSLEGRAGAPVPPFLRSPSPCLG